MATEIVQQFGGYREVSCLLVGLDPNYIQNDRYAIWYLNGSIWGSTTIPGGVEYAAGPQFTGLTPGTIYAVQADIYYINDFTGAAELIKSVYGTLYTWGRPDYFAWTVPKTAGGQYYVGSSEWDALLQNASTVVYYATGKVYYPAQTSPPGVGTLFTAARYNEVGDMVRTVPGYGYYIPQVSSGDIVTASQMNMLASELNAIP